MFKQAIAEAKSVREAAIANAKEALEETLTPHLKDMLAAKLQEMEDSKNEEEVVNEVEEEVEEAAKSDDKKDETVEEGDYSKEDKKEEAIEEDLSEVEPVGEADEDEKHDAEDDSEESEDEADVEVEAEPEAEAAEEVDGDEDLSKLSVDQFKDMIRDIIAQEVGGDAGLGDDMDGGDIEGLGDEAPIEEPGLDAEAEAEGEEEIDLDELLRELEAATEEPVSEDTANEIPAESDTSEKNVNDTLKEDLEEALETIETLRKDLQEVNLLNSKLLYVNKIFKANNLAESQKVNIIAAFDKAETVKEVKLVFETVSENVVSTKKEVSESKVKGLASKATGTTASKPEVISEVSDTVRRMQKLAGIIKS